METPIQTKHEEVLSAINRVRNAEIGLVALDGLAVATDYVPVLPGILVAVGIGLAAVSTHMLGNRVRHNMPMTHQEWSRAPLS